MKKGNSLSAIDVMSHAETVHPDAKISDIKHKLIGNEDCLLVIDDENRFLGEIHEKDLLKLIIPEYKIDEEEIGGVLVDNYDSKFFATNAQMLMRSHEITVNPTVAALDVALIMFKEDVWSIPVIRFNNIIGVVHLNKLIRKLLK